jgi:hypothetical protein
VLRRDLTRKSIKNYADSISNWFFDSMLEKYVFEVYQMKIYLNYVKEEQLIKEQGMV